jgi:hypothetical protein
VTERAVEIADGGGTVQELRENVGLGLRHAEPGPLQMGSDEMHRTFEILNHYDIVYYDMEMTDEELLDSFERGELQAADFPHERHLRVALLLAREPDGLARLAAGIRGIATRAGRPERYHETMTRAWFELVAAAGELRPELYDQGLLARYYSPAVLESGRGRWVEPDLHRLPRRRSCALRASI